MTTVAVALRSLPRVDSRHFRVRLRAARTSSAHMHLHAAARWLALLLITHLASAWNQTQEAAEVGAEVGAEAGPVCGEAAARTAEECLGGAYALFDRRNFTGIPASPAQLDAMCTAFERAFACLDSLARSCFGAEERRMYAGKVGGVKSVMEQLCQDRPFQQEYLKHSACYARLSNEWDACTRPLLTLLNLSETSEDQLGHICRVKREFLVCVTEVGARRCEEPASHFLSTLALTLSGSMDQCHSQAGAQPRPNKHQAPPTKSLSAPPLSSSFLPLLSSLLILLFRAYFRLC